VRKSYWVLLIFVLIGGLLGGVLGEILRVMAPHGTIQTIFATNFTPGINPPLTITREQADQGLDILDQVFARAAAELPTS